VSSQRTVSLALLTEDTYAPKFIEGIIKRLIETNWINNKINVYKSNRTYRKIQPCTDKLRRILSVAIDMCDKILIFLDADGRPRDEIVNEVKSHLGSELAKLLGKRIFVIVFHEEIEEWILPNTQKPSDVLKRKERYEKWSLPDHVNRVDFYAANQLDSFRDFINALNDC